MADQTYLALKFILFDDRFHDIVEQSGVRAHSVVDKQWLSYRVQTGYSA